MQYPLLFESPHWFREFVATLGILVTASALLTFWLGFFGVPAAVGATVLIIWLLHRRAVRIRGSRPPASA